MTVKAKLRKYLSKADLLVSASIHKVAISRIDLADQTFAVRDRADAACEPAAIQTERGVANFAGPHPVVLHAVDSRLVVINGFRRLRAANDARIKFVLCRVVRKADHFNATLLAARINLGHGVPLSLAERRRCFQKETAARKQAGYRDCSDREWARIYHVSPSTIGAWKKPTNKASKVASHRGETVQNGHAVRGGAAGRVAADQSEEATSTHYEEGEGPVNQRNLGSQTRSDVTVAEALLELRSAAELLREGARAKSPSADEETQIQEVITTLQGVVGESRGKGEKSK